MFTNRTEAGRRLAQALIEHAGDPNTTVMALPRGGVPVAAEICGALELPLELAFVRKIGAPGQPELAVGAVVDGADPHVEINRPVARMFGLNDAAVEAMGRAQLPEIARRRAAYCGDAPAADLTGRTVIVVDDGVATGSSLRAALASLSRRGVAKTIVALPVAPVEAVRLLEKEADAVMCLEVPNNFIAVGAHYVDFHQVDDQEIVEILGRLEGGGETGPAA